MDTYEVSDELSEKIENWFTYHPPKGDQPERYELIREHGKDFAQTIANLTPGSPEQTLALRHLEQAVMYANAAIARNE